MNSKRKAELEESLSSALEPPRKRQIARLDSILADYIDPRDVPSLPVKRENLSEQSATVLHTRVVRETSLVQDTTQDSETSQVNQTTLVQEAIEEPHTTQEQITTLAPDSIVASVTSPALPTSVAQDQGEPRHDARVETGTTQAQQTMAAQYIIVESEYTKTPNDVWDEIMPTLDPYDQSVLWQLYRLTRGYHRDNCTIGFPRLATRCNISPKQAQISVGRLEKRGLIKRTGSDFGNRNVNERGNIYEVFLPEGREAQRTRVARNARVGQSATVAPDTVMKINTQNENTQTQSGVSVRSRFSLEECRRYADHLKQTGQGITNPGGYATKIFRSGEADAFIETFLNPQAPLNISKCPTCRGSNFVYIDVSNPDRGVKPCRHEELLNQNQ